MKNTMNFMVDVLDDVMKPIIEKGDIAFVRSGFEVPDGEIGVVMVTDHDSESTKIHIRRIFYEDNRVILAASNRKYPALLFEGEQIENIRLLGPVYKTQKSGAPHQSKWISMSGIARRNRVALESNNGNIVGEPADE